MALGAAPGTGQRLKIVEREIVLRADSVIVWDAATANGLSGTEEPHGGGVALE